MLIPYTTYLVLRGPFLNGTRLPVVDQMLLPGCWYIFANHLLTLAFFLGGSFVSQ
jgi:hypothetical protein